MYENELGRDHPTVARAMESPGWMLGSKPGWARVSVAVSSSNKVVMVDFIPRGLPVV